MTQVAPQNPEAHPVRVMLVDDHAPTREQFRALIAAEPQFVVVAEAASGEAALPLGAQAKPDLVLMDIAMPAMTGLECARLLRKTLPGLRVLFLSNHGGRAILTAIREAGGLGYVSKHQAYEELLPAMRAVAAGLPAFPAAGE